MRRRWARRSADVVGSPRGAAHARFAAPDGVHGAAGGWPGRAGPMSGGTAPMRPAGRRCRRLPRGRRRVGGAGGVSRSIWRTQIPIAGAALFGGAAERTRGGDRGAPHRRRWVVDRLRWSAMIWAWRMRARCAGAGLPAGRSWRCSTPITPLWQRELVGARGRSSQRDRCELRLLERCAGWHAGSPAAAYRSALSAGGRSRVAPWWLWTGRRSCSSGWRAPGS